MIDLGNKSNENSDEDDFEIIDLEKLKLEDKTKSIDFNRDSLSQEDLEINLERLQAREIDLEKLRRVEREQERLLSDKGMGKASFVFNSELVSSPEKCPEVAAEMVLFGLLDKLEDLKKFYYSTDEVTELYNDIAKIIGGIGYKSAEERLKEVSDGEKVTETQKESQKLIGALKQIVLERLDTKIDEDVKNVDVSVKRSIVWVIGCKGDQSALGKLKERIDNPKLDPQVQSDIKYYLRNKGLL